MRENFIEETGRDEGEREQLCAHEQWEGIGEGATKRSRIVSRKGASSRTVYGEEEGGNRDLGQRSRESKWIMIGSIKSAQPTKRSP